VVAFTACQTARTLSPNLLSPNLCGDVDIGRLGGAHLSAKLREHRRAALDDAVAELRRLIREGFESGIPVDMLAEAAGLSVPRYQIRDGRR
jgi:hypothetical protein